MKMKESKKQKNMITMKKWQRPKQIWDKRNELCVCIKYYVVSGISSTARTDLAGIFLVRMSRQILHSYKLHATRATETESACVLKSVSELAPLHTDWTPCDCAHTFTMRREYRMLF